MCVHAPSDNSITRTIQRFIGASPRNLNNTTKIRAVFLLIRIQTTHPLLYTGAILHVARTREPLGAALEGAALWFVVDEARRAEDEARAAPLSGSPP